MKKGRGGPYQPRAPLTNLTTVKLSRKSCPKTSGRKCVESMLCKVHPELYIPPLTQPTNNAPDLYHFTRLGVLCWFEVEQSRMVVCWADLIWWSGLAVVVWSDGVILVVWSDDGLVWELVHGLICGRDLRLLWLAGVMVWSGADLMDCCCSLVPWPNPEVWVRNIVWSNGWNEN